MNKQAVSIIGILANLVLAIAKIGIGLISSSAAVLSDGIHSGVDIVSSGLNLVGVRLASKESDTKHPYGYHKYEVLAGFLIMLIVLGTGLYILYESYTEFMDPSFVTLNYLALGVMVFSAAINQAMSQLKIRTGKKENSLSLISDGIHSRIDVISSIALFVGLFLTPLFIYADAVLTALIGLYIIREALHLGKDATNSLLDVAADDETEQKIRTVVEEMGIPVKDLKTLNRGATNTAELSITLPKTLSLPDAEKRVSVVRQQLLNRIPSLSYVSIQTVSHDVEDNYYRPASFAGFRFGRGYGWRRRLSTKDDSDNQSGTSDVGYGPVGECVCPECGKKIPHEPGKPCASQHCPSCNALMTRGDNTCQEE